MRTLVVYDSVYGNTEKIAQAIGDALPGEVPVLHIGQVRLDELQAADLLFIGAPTHGSLPSPAMQAFLEKIGAPAQAGARAAAFDTRLTWGFLEKWGFAASRIADALRDKGWTIVGTPGGFFVRGLKRGPLKRGELERAAAWATEIARSAS